jgi:putative cardiolipin synthase
MELVLYFKTLNVRMHNKLMVVDGHWSIVGGRNIGNCYFGADKKYNFRDLDALVTGPITRDLANAFDTYWNSKPAYPAAAMGYATEKKFNKHVKRLSKYSKRDREFLEQTPFPLEARHWGEEFAQLPSKMIAGEASYFNEPPITDTGKDDVLLAGLESLLRNAQESVTMVTPYMIPPRALMRGLEAAAANRTEVNLVTASMAANNHTIAHSHYKKYRKRLLKNGATLHEYKGAPGAKERALSDTPPVHAKYIALHVKAVTLDHRYLVIGSVNLDPRALKINTENAMLIDSPALAAAFEASVAQMTRPENAWELYRNQHGFLRWRDDEKKLRIQPARGFCQRIIDFICRLLPIERQI